MKKKYVIFIYYIFIVLFCIVGTRVFYLESNINLYTSDAIINKEECDYYFSSAIEENEIFQYDWYELQLNDEMCNYIVANYENTGSFFLFFDKIISSSVFLFVFPFFVPIILLFPIIYNLSSEFKSGYIKNFLQRSTYKKYILHLFKESYKYFFIIPLILFYIMVLAYILSNGNFDPRMDIYRNFLTDDYLLFFNNLSVCVVYFVIILLNVFLYINIGLISMSHNNNFFIAMVESFLIIYLFMCFSFIFVGLTVQGLFGIAAEQINVLEIYTWHNITDYKLFLIVNLIYYLISLFFVYLCYRNKEKIVMLCEA